MQARLERKVLQSRLQKKVEIIKAEQIAGDIGKVQEAIYSVTLRQNDS